MTAHYVVTTDAYLPANALNNEARRFKAVCSCGEVFVSASSTKQVLDMHGDHVRAMRPPTAGIFWGAVGAVVLAAGFWAGVIALVRAVSAP